jgi:GH15 family glucan-1,4-alpha-glucosidase
VSDSARHPDRDGAGYADLRSYAPIGDGRTIALIARDGRIDWLPLPDLDSAPTFAALLDSGHGGYLSLCPTEPFETEREYVEGTNVLRTTFRTASGTATVTDSMNTGVAGRLPWAELARRIDGVSGSIRFRAVVSPGTGLDTASPWVHETVHGTVLRVDGVTMAPRTLNEAGVEVGEQHLDVHYQTRPGSRHLFGLVSTSQEPLYLPRAQDVDRGIDRTIENWRTWSRECQDARVDWNDAVLRSVLILKTLLCSPTGAIAAAATTSLPEGPAGGNNWDYRFAWTRDMTYTLEALFRFGLREETQAAVSWLLATIRRHDPEPRVCYRLNGDIPPETRTYDVPGWRGIGPVASGNRASGQLQLGVLGDLFTMMRLHVDHGNVLDEDTGRMLAGVADRACDLWHARDCGMWELPDPQHFTTSKIGCWQALRSAVALAEAGQIPGDPRRWDSESERIRAWVHEHCWDDERGAYVWYPGSKDLDASILLHAISGFDRGERMSSTLDVLRAELGSGPHLYRYSGASKTEGCFVACSFWLVSALHLTGRPKEARELMEELLTTTNDVGVLAEIIDPATQEFWGNLPQALSHLALVNAALTLSE